MQSSVNAASMKKPAIWTFGVMLWVSLPYEDKHCHEEAVHFHQAILASSSEYQGLLILHSCDCNAFGHVLFHENPLCIPEDKCHDLPSRLSNFYFFYTWFVGLLPLLRSFIPLWCRVVHPHLIPGDPIQKCGSPFECTVSKNELLLRATAFHVPALTTVVTNVRILFKNLKYRVRCGWPKHGCNLTIATVTTTL